MKYTNKNKKKGGVKTERLNKSAIKTVRHTKLIPTHQKSKQTNKQITLKKITEVVNYLKTVCPKSGICIAFGKHIHIIKQLFKNFSTFDFVVEPTTQIGFLSSNGFITELTYSRLNYTAHTILKSSSEVESDNLMYEYSVGLIINKLNMFIPNFIETYGLYKYANNDVYKTMKNNKTNNPSILKDGLLNQEINFKTGCENSLYIALLIQHIKNAKTTGQKIEEEKKINSNDFVKYDLIYIVYQVYFALATLRDKFVHYDLHSDNVMLYEPFPGKYIQYYYHLNNGKIIEFKSPYVAKIIDYGRSYYNFTTNNNIIVDSGYFRKQLCNEPECNPKCGYNKGFNWLIPHANDISSANNLYITPLINNPSHDLRFVGMVSQEWNNNINKPLYDLFENILYGEGIHKLINKKYGTRPHPGSGLPNYIANVTDAFVVCNNAVISDYCTKLNNEKYGDIVNKGGEMHIYENLKTPIQMTYNNI